MGWYCNSRRRVFKNHHKYPTMIRDKYNVSLLILTKQAGLAEITRCLGLQAHPSSVELGNPVPALFNIRTVKYIRTCWRMESGKPSTTKIDTQLQALSKKLGPGFDSQLAKLRITKEVVISIGVFTHRPMKSFSIGSEVLGCYVKMGCKIQVSLYSLNENGS